MPQIAVIGAGIVGAASALELLRDGHAVTIIEPGQPGGEQAASFGNGGWLSTSSVLPMSMPGTWRRVPGWLRDPLGPLAIDWRYLPRLLPWLGRFVRAGSSVARVEATARAMRPLIADAPERHRLLAEEAGVPGLIERRGLLYAYPTRAEFEGDALGWRLRRENGVRWLELDADELRQSEPALDRRYGFAALVEEGGHCTDPGAYVAALVAHAQRLGATLLRAAATGFRIEAGQLRAVLTDAGEVPCTGAVICAGARSRALARAAGDRVSLETERGYHAVVGAPEVTPALRHPVQLSDAKLVLTPMRGGVRAAGQVELAGLAKAPNWRRADILRDILRRSLPAMASAGPAERVTVWMGHRPSTPDSLPVIGPARSCPGIVHAFGHGHIGLAAGAMTGRLVADLLSGKPPTIDLSPYSPRRFRLPRRRGMTGAV